MSPSCIFCQISNGSAPSSTIYEDKDFMIIMDVYPLTDGHCLVLPKKHAIRLNELEKPIRRRLFELGYAVAESQKQSGLGVDGTNILLNDGKAANQTVPHLHLHIIPRKHGDLLKSLPRLVLHITGLFGLKRKRAVLDMQAKLLKATLPRDL